MFQNVSAMCAFPNLSGIKQIWGDIQKHKNQPGKLSTSLILVTFDIKPTDNTILPVNTHV
jgi:hypothetical protein